MGRGLWFAVGLGAGLYGSLKARRLAYRVSPAGLADQAAALRLGARTLADDVAAATREREDELLGELGLPRRSDPVRPARPIRPARTVRPVRPVAAVETAPPRRSDLAEPTTGKDVR